jgi:hypothetical protein
VPDIPQNDVHFFIKTIQQRISNRLVCEGRLDFQPECVTDLLRQQQHQGNDPAAGPKIHDGFSRLYGDKFGKQNGIDGKPVPVSGLDQLQTALHEFIEGFVGLHFNGLGSE